MLLLLFRRLRAAIVHIRMIARDAPVLRAETSESQPYMMRCFDAGALTASPSDRVVLSMLCRDVAVTGAALGDV